MRPLYVRLMDMLYYACMAVAGVAIAVMAVIIGWSVYTPLRVDRGLILGGAGVYSLSGADDVLWRRRLLSSERPYQHRPGRARPAWTSVHDGGALGRCPHAANQHSDDFGTVSASSKRRSSRSIPSSSTSVSAWSKPHYPAVASSPCCS